MSTTKTYTLEEAAQLLKNGQVRLTPPAPYGAGLLSANWMIEHTPNEVGNAFLIKLPKLSMANFGISIADMPSKTTFPADPNAKMPCSLKLNVPLNPNKTFSDICSLIQDTLIAQIEKEKPKVCAFHAFLTTFLVMLTHTHTRKLISPCSGRFQIQRMSCHW